MVGHVNAYQGCVAMLGDQGLTLTPGHLRWQLRALYLRGTGKEHVNVSIALRPRVYVHTLGRPFRLLAEREQLHAEFIAQEIVHLPAQCLGQ